MRKRDTSHYRNFSTLVRRRYADNDVASHVLGLSDALRKAVVQGHDHADDIVVVLRICEPFNAVDDLHRAYLHIAFLAYAMHDEAAALEAAEKAELAHGDDERLRRIVEQLRFAGKGGKKR